MDHFAGLDVSVKDTSVCIVDSTGKIIREVKVWRVNPTLCWRFSVRPRMRGGAGRTRTSDQTIISSWLAKCLQCRGLCVRALCLRKQPIEFQWNDFGGLVSANKNSVSSHGD